MGTVGAGDVDYTTYYGDIALRRKDGSAIKFGNAKNYDEEFALKEKQKLQDGDRVSTGKKSFITIMGHPKDGQMQMLTVFPESEFVLGIGEWEAAVKGEQQKGAEISGLKFVKGTFYVMPAGAALEIPMAKVRHIDKKREMKFMLDIVQGMTVILPGSKMEVTGGGKTYETWPAYGSLGMTEIMVTTGGMYEKSMEVDERAGMLASSLLQMGMGMPQEFKYDEGLMDYSARKTAESKKKSAEYAKNALSEADIEKMEKAKSITESQAELARAMAKATKAAGGSSSPAFGINMLANLDLSKLKDMPGLTPEQKKQIEEGIPAMAKMQKELSGAKLAQITAQTNLSEKYMETARNDPVAKKQAAKAKADFKEKFDSFSLPPYPRPDEKFRVK
ncbi:MAG: hypothetical protein NT157_01635 [Candidatus Micrarchaeota archaeon]|nr:hypothetical protein [Candidatus Micrarchaeota archaeon]